MVQTDEQGIVLYANGHEHLITMANYELRDEQGKEAAKVAAPAMSWVTAVPAPPDEYAVESPDVFEEVIALADSLRPPPPPFKSSEPLELTDFLFIALIGIWIAVLVGVPLYNRKQKRTGGGLVSWWGAGGFLAMSTVVLLSVLAISGTKARDVFVNLKDIKVLPAVAVGEYEIQPLKATGKQAVTSLNVWLKANQFRPMKGRHIDYYANKGWTFLAVKVNKPADAEALPASGAVRPLRISFRTDRIYYPLKISANQGAFSVGLCIITESKEPSVPEKFGFSKDVSGEFQRAALKPALAGLLQHATEKGGFTESPTLRLTRVVAGRVNTESQPLNDWDEDFTVSVKEPTAPVS